MNEDIKYNIKPKRISLDCRKIKIENSNFEPFPSHLKYWLLEDLRHGILPYKLKHSEEFKCYLVPEIKLFEKIIINNLNIHDKKFNLDDTIYHFIEKIAVDLINYGQCIIESVFDVQYNYFELYDISDCNIKINSKNITQKISKIVQKDNSIPKRLKIPKTNCLVLEFPNRIGGKKKYLKLLEKYAQPDPLLKQHEFVIRQAQGEQLNYDFIEHNKMIDLKQWRESNFI